MRKLIIKSYHTGKVLAKKTIKSQASITYRCEYIGSVEYMVIRDYYTNNILQKFKKTGTKWDTSIEFYVQQEGGYEW